MAAAAPPRELLPHLLHQQEDVCLRCFQHVAVRMLQAFHGQTHGPAVNVDPAGGPGGQECPEHTETPQSQTASEFSLRWLEHRVSYLKMVSAFADMEDAVPHFSSSAASQKAKFSPVMWTYR